MKYPAWSIASVSGAVKTISRPPSAGSSVRDCELSGLALECTLGTVMKCYPRFEFGSLKFLHSVEHGCRSTFFIAAPTAGDYSSSCLYRPLDDGLNVRWVSTRMKRSDLYKTFYVSVAAIASISIRTP